MKKLILGAPTPEGLRVPLTTAPPAARKSQEKTTTITAEKPWGDVLSRRQIEADYGWSSKTTARMEKDGKLIPSVIGGKGEGKTKRYYRSDIEKLLRNSYENNMAWQQKLQATSGKENTND